MRAIDADALKVNVARMSGNGDYVESVWWDIDHAPTADAVEVVRCKDCKYGIDWDGRLGCEWHGFYQTEPDWFCADGERKETEDGEIR